MIIYYTREKVGTIRHNLAHINISQDYTEIKTDLLKLIEEFKQIIESRLLYKLDKTLDQKKQTVKYKLQEHEKEVSFFAKNKNTKPKLITVVNKYKDGTLDSLTDVDTQGVKKYLDKNLNDIENLITKRKKRELLIKQKQSDATKTMPNGDERLVKDLSKPRKKTKIVQTEEDKKIIQEGNAKLFEHFANR